MSFNKLIIILFTLTFMLLLLIHLLQIIPPEILFPYLYKIINETTKVI